LRRRYVILREPVVYKLKLELVSLCREVRFPLVGQGVVDSFENRIVAVLFFAGFLDCGLMVRSNVAVFKVHGANLAKDENTRHRRVGECLLLLLSRINRSRFLHRHLSNFQRPSPINSPPPTNSTPLAAFFTAIATLSPELTFVGHRHLRRLGLLYSHLLQGLLPPLCL